MTVFPYPYGKSHMRFFSLLISVCVCGCSLDYGRASQAQIQTPEFVFQDVRFTHVEHNNVKLNMKAGKIEQYAGIDIMYGQDVQFVLYDNENHPSLTGSCSLLSADKENRVYHFFSDIYIKSHKHRARILAENLRWNEQTSVLDSSKDDFVSISLETDNGSLITIQGKGFSAKKQDLSFCFEENVNGTLINAQADFENSQNAPDNAELTDDKTAAQTEKKR